MAQTLHPCKVGSGAEEELKAASPPALPRREGADSAVEGRL